MRATSALTEQVLPPGVRPAMIEPLYERVSHNRASAAVFTVAFVLFTALAVAVPVALLTALGAAIWLLADGGAAGAGDAVWRTVLVAAGVAFGLTLVAAVSWVAFRLSRPERLLLRTLRARITNRGELADAKSVLKDMAIAAGFRHSPQLYVIEEPRVNAFALGRTHEEAVIGVTTGFAERLTPDEQRAVFANLMARICSLDIRVATAVSALMGPVWAARDWDLKRAHETFLEHKEDPETAAALAIVASGRGGAVPIVPWFIAQGIFVLVTEILSWWHLETAWTASEKADAEGMLLLKDPRSMLSALKSVLDADNHVPSAGDAYSQLFYCWAGFGFAPEDDPEYRRVSRLCEVLGAEGLAERPAPNLAWGGTAPLASAAAAAQARRASGEGT